MVFFHWSLSYSNSPKMFHRYPSCWNSSAVIWGGGYRFFFLIFISPWRSFPDSWEIGSNDFTNHWYHRHLYILTGSGSQFPSFSICGPFGRATSTKWQMLFFWLIYTKSHLIEFGWFVYIIYYVIVSSPSPNSLFLLFYLLSYSPNPSARSIFPFRNIMLKFMLQW